jgi:hypothetical protein
VQAITKRSIVCILKYQIQILCVVCTADPNQSHLPKKKTKPRKFSCSDEDQHNFKLVDEEQQDLELVETRIVKFFNKECEQVEEEYGGTKSVMVEQISLPD